MWFHDTKRSADLDLGNVGDRCGADGGARRGVGSACETDARLWEISENLHRCELTVQERADHIAEWVKLTKEKLGQSAQVSNERVVGGRGKEGGLSAAVRDLGIDRTEARRAVKIASITPEARAAAGLETRASRQVVPICRATLS